jgi:hypothetical protein
MKQREFPVGKLEGAEALGWKLQCFMVWAGSVYSRECIAFLYFDVAMATNASQLHIEIYNLACIVFANEWS